MFTKDAWNALLKTIEEPPAHVIFILATTEINKVPETIISRCQSFVFKKPTDAILVQVITRVALEEGYALEEGGASLIALLADGAFRDALGTLQKVLSFAKGKKISLKDIEEVTGAPKAILVNDYLNALATSDIEMGYKAIRKASENNIEMDIYLKMILAKLRYALMLRYAPATIKSVENLVSEDDLVFIKNLIVSKPEHISSTTLSILLDAYQAMHTSVIAELPLELSLIKILNGKA